MPEVSRRSARFGIFVGQRDSLMATTSPARRIGLLAALLTVALLIVGPANAAAEPLCTDTWTGPSEGSWQTASNWSANAVPTSSDVVCVGSGSTVQVSGGTNYAGSIQDEGSLVLSGGSLELASALEASSVAGLSLGEGSLIVVGELVVSGSFSADGDSSVGGGGRLVVGSGASGTLGSGSECSVHLALSSVTFVNDGTLTFGGSGGVGAGAIAMREGAAFDNAGAFYDNSYDSGCGYGVGGSHYTIYGTGGATPSVTNTGTFKADAGTGQLVIAVPFNNQGTAEVSSGLVRFVGGGSGSSGTWSAASESTLAFAGGSLSVSGSTWSGAGTISVEGMSLNTAGLEAGDANVNVGSGSLSVPEGSTISMASLVLDSSSMSVTGELVVSGSFAAEGETAISGSGRVTLASGASGTLGSGSECSVHLALSGVTFVNDGTLTFGGSGGVGAGAIAMREGAAFDNAGAFYDNSYDSGCGYGVGGGHYTMYNTGGTSSVTNTGTFTANAGSSRLVVGVPYDNQGATESVDGQLIFIAGGVPEHVAVGIWKTKGSGSIVLNSGTFLIGEDVNLSEVEVEGATVEREPASGPPKGALDAHPYASGTVTISGEGSSVGSGFSSASIEVTPAGHEEWKTLCGSLTPSLIGEFSCSWDTSSGSYPDGHYQLRAQLSDSVEPPNTASTARINILVDNTAPSGSVTAVSYIGGTAASVSGTASDSGSGVASWQLQIAPEGSSTWSDACAEQTAPISGSTYGCAVSTTSLANGAYNLRALITDNAGNTYTTSTTSTTVDKTPPTGSLETVSEISYLKGSVTLKGAGEDSLSGVASWTVQITPTGAGSWSNACTPQTTPVSGSTYECTVDTGDYSEGAYQLRARVLDNAGNAYTTSAQSVMLDNTPPSGSLAQLGRYSKGTVEVKGPATDPVSGVVSWQLQITPTGEHSWTNACPSQTSPSEGLDEYGCSLDTTELADGSYQLHAVITDNAGNIYTTNPIATDIDNSETEEGVEAGCTDTWTGDEGGKSWQTAGDWFDWNGTRQHRSSVHPDWRECANHEYGQ